MKIVASSPEVEKLLGSFKTCLAKSIRRSRVQQTKNSPVPLEVFYNNLEFSQTGKIGLELFAQKTREVTLKNVIFDRLYLDGTDFSCLLNQYRLVCLHDPLPVLSPDRLPVILNLAMNCLDENGILLMSQSLRPPPEEVKFPTNNFSSFFFQLGLVKARNFFSNIYIQIRDDQQLILATNMEAPHA